MNRYEYEEIKLGHIEEFQTIVSQNDQNMFREITGDINPLHSNIGFANRKGFERPVVFGLLTASYYSTLAGVYIPGEKSLIHSVNIKFGYPVLVGEKLLIRGEVIDKNDTFKRLTIKAEIINQEGKKISKAKLEVGVLD